jgi:integrase
MPKLKDSLPKYRFHRASGQAVVTLDGQDFYLGPHGSSASKVEYDRLVGEWLAGGRRMVPTDNFDGVTVVELLAAFANFAKSYYNIGKDGEPSKELESYRMAARPLKELYGKKPIAEFGPLSLKAVRQKMIDGGWARTNINRQINRIRRIFKWGVENEIVPPSVLHGLQAVTGLKSGRSEARESEPVKAVPDSLIEPVLRCVSPQVAAMIRLQRLTGMRSGEVVCIRGSEIDMTDAVWVYRPAHHKTAWRGHIRRICLGPQAQEILRPFLKLKSNPAAYLFSPHDAEAGRNADRRRNRMTPMTPSQAKRHAKRRPRRPKGDRYTVDSYRRAISYGIKKSGVGHWHPHQLRHTAATSLRREFGLETARIVLGHKTAAITEVYAEADHARAVEAMTQVG